MSGKYKEIDKTTISDAIIPPFTVHIQIVNTETGERTDGYGSNYSEARENAWDKINKGD
jgi:hypothetical protein